VPYGLAEPFVLKHVAKAGLALRPDGSVAAWVADFLGCQTNVPAGLSNVVAVACCSDGTCFALIGTGPPVLTSPLTDRQAFVGGTAYFRAAASGAWPLSYQWYFNGAPIVGATNSTLALAGASLDQAGNYSVTGSNVWGVVTSREAQLKVIPPFIADPLVAQIPEDWMDHLRPPLLEDLP
jgi:hypothetical protein